jgi:hypothetical protein
MIRILLLILLCVSIYLLVSAYRKYKKRLTLINQMEKVDEFVKCSKLNKELRDKVTKVVSDINDEFKNEQ